MSFEIPNTADYTIDGVKFQSNPSTATIGRSVTATKTNIVEDTEDPLDTKIKWTIVFKSRDPFKSHDIQLIDNLAVGTSYIDATLTVDGVTVTPTSISPLTSPIQTLAPLTSTTYEFKVQVS